VAENETLDLRKSARWNRARWMLSDGASPQEISVEIRRCVEAILARLHKLMPLAELMTEILSPWGSPDLLLERCKDAADYAQLMLQIGRFHKNRNEWLRLAEIHRDGVVPWARWLLSSQLAIACETERYAEGF